MNLQFRTTLTPELLTQVDALERSGIRVMLRQMGDRHLSCRARWNSKGDSLVTYARDPNVAVQQTLAALACRF